MTALIFTSWDKTRSWEGFIADRTDFVLVEKCNGPDNSSYFRFSCITDLVFAADETHEEETISIKYPCPPFKLIPEEIIERVRNSVRARTEMKDDDY